MVGVPTVAVPVEAGPRAGVASVRCGQRLTADDDGGGAARAGVAAWSLVARVVGCRQRFEGPRDLDPGPHGGGFRGRLAIKGTYVLAWIFWWCPNQRSGSRWMCGGKFPAYSKTNLGDQSASAMGVGDRALKK